MNLLIFGPPGSGKGTYISRLAPKLGIAKIITGDLLRDIAKEESTLGKKVAAIQNSGGLVPDEITNEVIKKRILYPDTKGGMIIDGYPRTLDQAKFLEKLVKVDLIINLMLPEKILIEKISARRVCKNCGEVYNIADINEVIDGVDYILPPMNPKKTGVCDKCSGELIQRNDDKPETVKERMRIYEQQSKPVIGYYKDKIKFLNVQVTRGPEIIVEKIANEIKKMGIK